jgi:hypothetical protein
MAWNSVNRKVESLSKVQFEKLSVPVLIISVLSILIFISAGFYLISTPAKDGDVKFSLGHLLLKARLNKKLHHGHL